MPDVNELIFAVMKASGGRIEGRTKLQKLVFFLAEALRTDAGYQPHFYGPYSSVVSAATESQVSRGALRETVEEFRGRPGFAGNDDEYRRYVYVLTSDGRKASEWWREQNPDEFDKALRLAEELVNTGADYRVLSYAAKLYYILRDKQEPLTYNTARQRARELGWDMTGQEIETGVGLLVRANLVSEAGADAD